MGKSNSKYVSSAAPPTTDEANVRFSLSLDVPAFFRAEQRRKRRTRRALRWTAVIVGIAGLVAAGLWLSGRL